MKSVNKNIISEFLLYIENQRKFSSHTIRAYKYDLNEFELFLRNYDEKVNIKDIDTSAIQYFIQSLAKVGLEGKTMQRKISSIKSFFRFLAEKELIKYNIADLIQIPKASKKLPYLLSRDEIEKLMLWPDLSTYLGVRDKSILEILYSTGLRISELKMIEINNIDVIIKELAIPIKEAREAIGIAPNGIKPKFIV